MRTSPVRLTEAADYPIAELAPFGEQVPEVGFERVCLVMSKGYSTPARLPTELVPDKAIWFIVLQAET
jgi:hypothetical protein